MKIDEMDLKKEIAEQQRKVEELKEKQKQAEKQKEEVDVPLHKHCEICKRPFYNKDFDRCYDHR